MQIDFNKEPNLFAFAIIHKNKKKIQLICFSNFIGSLGHMHFDVYELFQLSLQQILSTFCWFCFSFLCFAQPLGICFLHVMLDGSFFWVFSLCIEIYLSFRRLTILLSFAS